MHHALAITALLLAAACTKEQAPPESPVVKRAPADIIAESAPEDWRALDPENLLVIELERGRVVVALSRHLAQNHVTQIKALAREGFYDGLSFYRVIDGFVAQGGDALETREIKSAQKTIKAMFDQPLTADMIFTALKDADGYAAKTGFLDSQPAGVNAGETVIWGLHCTGAMAMARNIEKDTGGTEFYITLQPQRYLDRNLTVFGHVIDGMEHLQALRRVEPPQTADGDMGETILSMRVGADLAGDRRPVMEILRSDTATFAAYAESRRNRPEDFFYHRPDYLDVCALTVPVRKTKGGGE